MMFPSPGWRHPFRCFWVAIWNWGELTGQMLGIRSSWLFGKALGQPGRRVR
jgi:hypothetical protein